MRAGAAEWRGRLGALALGVVLAAVLGELGVRACLPGYTPISFDIYRQDGQGRVRLQPHARRQHASPEWNVLIETNAAGLRDTDEPARPGQPVLIVLGDSLAFGWGVEYAQAFPTRLEAALGARVVKAGIPGTGPGDQLELLRELLQRTRPEAVVLAFFVGNDFADVAAGGDAQYEIVDGLRVLKGRPRGFGARLAAWIKRRSYLAQFVAERLWSLDLQRNAGLSVEQRGHPGLARRDAFLERYIEVHRQRALPPDLQRGVSETLRILDEMRRECAAAGARFVLCVVPRSLQVYPADRRRYEQAFGLEAGDWDLDRPQRFLAEWAGARPDVELVDLLPAFRAAADASTTRLYFFPDSHMTAAGHAQAAAVLARRLARSAQARPQAAAQGAQAQVEVPRTGPE